jgi:hypothetical protein
LKTRVRAADVKGIKRQGIRKALVVAVGVMLSVTAIRATDALVSVVIESATKEGKASVGTTSRLGVSPAPQTTPRP